MFRLCRSRVAALFGAHGFSFRFHSELGADGEEGVVLRFSTSFFVSLPFAASALFCRKRRKKQGTYCSLRGKMYVFPPLLPQPFITEPLRSRGTRG